MLLIPDKCNDDDALIVRTNVTIGDEEFEETLNLDEKLSAFLI